LVLARLQELTGNGAWRERAEALLNAFAGRAAELGLYAATYLLAVDWHLNPATHLVVIGKEHDTTVWAMHREALAKFAPRRVVQLLGPGEAAERPLPPALRGMLAAGDAPRGYACTGASCSPPASSLASWDATLDSLRPEVPA
jgi:uncharacterized protein YyaL (SSP411 family)